MVGKLFSLFGHLPLISLIIAVGVLPLVFTTKTTDYYELPKTLFLIAFLTVFLVSWLFLNFWQKTLKISVGPLALPILILWIWTLLSTLMSMDRSVSFSGWLRLFPASFLGVTLFTLFFISLTSMMRKLTTIKRLFIYFHFSVTFLSLLGILSAFGIHIFPMPETHTSFWTPGGNNVHLTGITSVLGLLVGFGLLWQTLKVRRTLILSSLVVSLLVIFFYLALLNIFSLWLLLGIGLITFLILVRKFDTLLSFILLFTTMAAILLMVLRLFFFSDQKVPTFASLPVAEALQITGQTVAKYPIFGTGPGTFNFNFRQFKSNEFNQTPYYNLNFETSDFWIIDLVGTIGIIGTIAYLSLFLITIFYLFRLYRQKDPNLRPLTSLLLSLVLVLTLSSFILPMNTMLYFFIFLVLGLAWALLKVSWPNLFHDYRLKFSDTGWLLTLGVVGVLVFSISLGIKIFRSDRLTRSAEKLASSSPETSYNQMLQAIRINKNADFLHRQFALTNLALATSVANNPNLDEKEKLDTTTTLVKQVLNEVKAATTVNPNDSRNWKLYGTILLQLNKALGSSEVEVKEKFEKALLLEPKDPESYLNLGLLSISEKNYFEAIRTLEKGVSIKANYYPLRQQLAEAYLLQAEVEPQNKQSFYSRSSEEFNRALDLIDQKDPQKTVLEQKLKQVNETLKD